MADGATPSLKSRVSEAEWQVRVELAALYRLVALNGWDDMIFTHISARVPGPEHHFLINPYNLMFEEITASSLVKIDVHGNPVMETPYLTNPAGFTIHSAIHMAREDAHAVIHLHTPHDQAVSAQAEGLMPLTQTAMLIRDELSYHHYEGVATDLDERERLVEDLGGTKTAMIGNVVESRFLVLNDYPTASALSVLLMGAILLLVGFYAKRSGTADLL